MENPETVDVDATTSASVLPPGNAAKMAGRIQEEIGGGRFGQSLTAIAKLAPDSTIGEGLAIIPRMSGYFQILYRNKY